MRVLFCASPGVGHAEPMTPLLRAFIQRGHELAWAGATESHRRAQTLGVQRCFAVGPSSADTRAEYNRRWPQALNAAGPAADPLVFPRRFGALLAPAMLDPLVRAIETWRPALVVSELGVLAAPLACKLTGCQQVTHGFGMPPAARSIEQAADAFAQSWRSRTSGPPPRDAGLFSHLYLDLFPRALQAADRQRTTRCQALRPCTPQRKGAAPLPDARAASLVELDDRPLAYLTFGTVVNRAEALITAARALADLQLRLVVTVGSDGDPSALGDLPPNVHVDRFVPQSALLPYCDLVVSHGGSGTLLATLAHGVPQLVLPQGADQFTNASALEASGAGLALRGDDITVARIRDCAQRLLLNPDHRQQAATIADEILAMPSAEEVAIRLERAAEAGVHVL
jgi:UDP:flavonoid glycosyltransferase YjiC (YdhE family)